MALSHRTAALAAAVGTCAVLTGALGLVRRAQQAPPGPLPTGRSLVGVGTQTSVGSFPTNIVTSPDGRWLAVTTSGAREYLSILSATDGRLVSQLPFNLQTSASGSGKKLKETLYAGLTFAPPGSVPNGSSRLYASRGGEDRISIFNVDADGNLKDIGRALDDAPVKNGGADGEPNFVAQIALNSTGAVLYAANNESGEWSDYKGSVSVIDAAANRVLGRVATPGFPYALTAITRGSFKDKRIYVASERDAVVSVIDVSDSASPRLLQSIRVGDHPSSLLLNADQTRLFAANSSSDSVSVIDTRLNRVVDTIGLRPREVGGLPGMTPTGMSLAPDGTRLYVTLADWNAVAIVQLSAADSGATARANRNSDDVPSQATADRRSRTSVLGYFPTGWYPTAVQTSADGARLFVANAKGNEPANPNAGPSGPGGAWGKYIEDIIDGTIAVVRVPGFDDAVRLNQSTQAVMQSVHPWGLETAEAQALAKHGVRHVFYIIKENRTYDQVLGDAPAGNGDPTLTMFGRDITPNIHALAERFVLLDNFYDCAEVSADGWNWSTSGMTSEYEQRNTRINYSGRGRSYDFEGATNRAPVDLLGMTDVNEAPGGYIWDQCRRHGVSYRGYGFFVSGGDVKSVSGDLLVKDNTPLRRALVGHSDDNYRQFDLGYADSDAWVKWNAVAPGQKRTYGAFNEPSRFSEWLREFRAFEANGKLPAFEMIRLPVDHTAGTSPGMRSPRAMVADNDYGVGQIVEAVSHSRYWNDSAIFVLEDDAQNGNDHVDAHRSICLVVSPRIRRGTVDHHFYNTDSVLRTMETVLGIPPMNQYDAWAPLLASFGAESSNSDPYSAILPARDIIGQVNLKTAYRADDSSKLDFSQADRAPEQTLNDILWHDSRGANVPRPAVRHTLVTRSGAEPDGD